jgi:hypothetical protein
MSYLTHLLICLPALIVALLVMALMPCRAGVAVAAVASLATLSLSNRILRGL